MYRITTPSGEFIMTEKVNYIRVHKSGTYLLTDVTTQRAWHTTEHRTCSRTVRMWQRSTAES